LWQLTQQINRGVFEGRATVIKRSVLEALPEIRADVAYFDPPYPGVMSYEREYKVIDEIFEGHSNPTSPFTAVDGANMIDGLFERAQHVPIWILSLGNAVVGVEELEAKMLRFGRRVKSIALNYQHLPAVATEHKKATNQEFIVVGVDEARLAELETRRRDSYPYPMVEQDIRLLGSKGQSAGTLTGNPGEQSKAHFTQQFPAPLCAESFSVRDLGVDDPDTGLVEGPIDSHCELGFAGHDARGSLQTDPTVKENS